MLPIPLVTYSFPGNERVKLIRANAFSAVLDVLQLEPPPPAYRTLRTGANDERSILTSAISLAHALKSQ